MTTSSTSFDVIIIGSGPGGTQAAKRLAGKGKKVALVSKELGGECLNYGCIPTKTLLWSVELLERIKEGGTTLGIETQNVTVNWEQMQRRRIDVISKIKKQLAFSMQKSGATIIEGTGSFVDAHTIEVTSQSGEKQTLTAPNIIIATGSYARTLPGFEWSDRNLNNKSLLELPALPKSLIIIGGGVVGVEFASLFAGLGVDVTIAEAANQILPLADPDIGQELERIFIRKKIKILNNVKISPEDAGKYEKVLVAIGRLPSIESLNLALADIKSGNHGIEINEFNQTSSPHIYAVGDCTDGKWNLAYTAEKEGEIAADHILGNSPLPLSKHAIPVTIFSLPEVAFVGRAAGKAENEEKITDAEIVIGKSSYSANAKALIMVGRDGFAKVLADKKSKKILGVHLIGERASELIAEASLAIAHDMTIEDFSRSLHSHPVTSEVLKEAMQQL